MAYTPINWQTGDTITAEKLNRCDNGWGVESTQLFSETVTTVVDGETGDNTAELSYEEPINADTITVTFDGTDYTCSRIYFNGNSAYGGFSTSPVGPDFTSYPFFIFSGNGNFVYTETAGTYTVSVNVTSVEISPNFKTASIAATASAIAVVSPYIVEVDETPLSNIYGAIRSGRLPIIVYKSTQSGAPAYIELVIYARPYNRTVRSIKIADDGSITVVNYTADSVDGPIYPPE